MIFNHNKGEIFIKNSLKNSTVTPVVYSVSDIQQLLGIGINQAYDLVRSDVFPVKKINSKYVIPIRTFEDWLYSLNDKAV